MLGRVHGWPVHLWRKTSAMLYFTRATCCSIRRMSGMVGISCLLVVLLMLLHIPAPATCQGQVQNTCVARQRGTQPDPIALVSVFEQAGTARLGTRAPSLQLIKKGYPLNEVVEVPPYVPCILLQAIAAVESAQTRGAPEFNGWKQFNAAYGAVGDTVVNDRSGLCAFGIMQLIEGMNSSRPFPIGSFDAIRAAVEPAYNVGAATKLLIHKWNTIPNAVGTNDPAVAEDWYFAVWAYNGLSPINNPGNFPPGRPSWRCHTDPLQDPNNWPYQELVWGCAAHPPDYPVGTDLYQPLSLTLPQGTITHQTAYLKRPEPYHFSCGVVFITPVAR